MGLAMAATLYEPAFAVVVSWFVRGRDRALLTVTLVAGFASTIFMPIEAWLLVRVGWRSALTILAVVLAVVTIPIHALVLRRGAAAVVTPATGGPPPSPVVMGAPTGVPTLSRAPSLARIFGARHYGAISGAVALGANGARAVGPVGASLLLVALGAYPSVFWALSASLIVASLSVLLFGAGVKNE